MTSSRLYLAEDLPWHERQQIVAPNCDRNAKRDKLLGFSVKRLSRQKHTSDVGERLHHLGSIHRQFRKCDVSPVIVCGQSFIGISPSYLDIFTFLGRSSSLTWIKHNFYEAI